MTTDIITLAPYITDGSIIPCVEPTSGETMYHVEYSTEADEDGRGCEGYVHVDLTDGQLIMTVFDHVTEYYTLTDTAVAESIYADLAARVI